MTISHVGAATGAATSFALPAHSIGDLIVIFAFRDGSATPPSLPSGYTTIATRAGTTCSSRLGFKIATSTSDASGAWTNSTTTSAVVWTSSLYSTGGSLCVGTNSVNSGTTNTINFAALASVFHADSTSWIAGFVGHRSVDQNLSANPPSGMTFIASSDLTNTAEACAYDTNATANSWGSTNITGTGTASGWTTQVVEIVENQPGTALANIVQHISFGYTDTNATGATNDLFLFNFDPTLASNGLALGLVYPTGTAPTITDDKGNTWPASPEVVADPGSGNALGFWHINNATTGTSQIKVSWGGVPKASVKAWVTQLYNVTGTVESTNTWKLVGTAPASGVLTPGSQTPSVDNCLILSYMAFADNNVSVNPALIIAETGYNLNDADISWGVDGIPNASQYTLQGTKAATTPRFYLNFAGVANNYNVISIALSTGSQGTPKPSGAGVAPWVDRILHFGSNKNPLTWLLQIPATGNAAAILSFLSSTGSQNLSSFIDNDSVTWTKQNPSSGDLVAPTRVNSSARSNRTGTATITSGGGPNVQFIYYDISNCATSPIVATAGTVSNTTANTTIANQPNITPTATNQLTIAYQQLGVGPYWGVTAPTGAILDLPFATQWQGTASIATATMTVTATAWGSIFTGSPVLSDAGSHVALGTTLISGTGPYTLSASQGVVASETMFLSSSDTDSLNWGNGAAHYFNGGSTAQQQWTWGIAQQPGGGGGKSIAIIFAGPPAGAAAPNGWQPVGSPPATPVVPVKQAWSFVPFDTAQIPIQGMAWWRPLDAVPAAHPPAKQAWTFVPLDTAQVAAGTPQGWQTIQSNVPVRMGAVNPSSLTFVVAPFITPQGWETIQSTPPSEMPFAKQAWTFVPLDTPQVQTTPVFGWEAVQFAPPPVSIQAKQAWSFVPLDTAQVQATAPAWGWQTIQYTPPFPSVQAKQAWIFVPTQVQAAPANGWETIQSFPPPKPLQAQQAYFFTPLLGPQALSFGWLGQIGGGAAPSRLPQAFQSQPTFVVVLSAPAAIGGIPWMVPLAAVPPPLRLAPQAFTFVPLDTTQVAPPASTLIQRTLTGVGL